jgi:hypothetical protein
MTLSTYHQKHADRPEEQVLLRLQAKKNELIDIFAALNWKPQEFPVRVAVLGCASKQLCVGHVSVFTEAVGGSVDITTFDITTEHLLGAENVVQHDCTQPLPGGPYDITYGHVLLKFMPQGEQWQVLQNSYDALRSGGLALHIMDKDGKVRPTEMMEDGCVDVPLAEHVRALEQAGIPYEVLTIKVGPRREGEGTCLVLKKS